MILFYDNADEEPQPQYDDLTESNLTGDQLRSDPDFEDKFSGVYQLNDQSFAVNIERKRSSINEKISYFLVTYPDDKTKLIDWSNNFGWTERGAGPTEHANAIGYIIEAYFSKNENFQFSNEPLVIERPKDVPKEESSFFA